ncbi:MAG: NAD(P)/FAD-dependent oxidoreductase [Candidatus Nanopelagicales bacterium]
MSDISTARQPSATGQDAAPLPTAVVVGGGFGGYYASRELTRHGIATTLVDATGFQTFQPLLYQAATGLVRASDVEFPLGELRDVDVVTDRVAAVDLGTRTLTLASGATTTADHVVIATGAVVNFFGVEGAAEHAYPLYTSGDGARIKEQLQRLVESGKPFSVVVVGAGDTGVEVTGALLDVLESALPRTYPGFTRDRASVHLVDHGAAPLAHMTPGSQRYAEDQLNAAGVTFHLGTSVTGVDDRGVELDGTTRIDSQLVIWAGGLTVSTPSLDPATKTNRGRIVVDEYLRVPGARGVYAIGDCAADETAPLPQLGAVAKQQGLYLGKSIARMRAGKAPKAFKYRDMGDMAMVRAGAAVVEIDGGHIKLDGPSAFATWLGLHAYLLPSEHHRADAVHGWVHEWRTGSAEFLT